ncbi:MAG: beta-ketoacyl-ACP synthase [Pseudomonadota bacterium]
MQTEAAEIRITGIGLVSCLGRGAEAHLDALRDGRSGLTICDWGVPFPCHIGRVAGVEGDAFPAAHAAFDNRANRLALAALATDGLAEQIAAARSRHGAGRIGLVVGTSTSGVERLETAYRSRPLDAALPAEYSLRHHNDHHAVAAFLHDFLDIQGPGHTVSTACSSSAKALIDAVHLIEAGLCDAVLAGGVDSLCFTSLAGFEALELVSRAPCRPCDAARDGLSIGEGAAFLLVERAADGPRLSGYGETSDGTNMSTPPEDGRGAAEAMRAALARAGLTPEQIAYVNLHGTATPANDASEGAAVSTVLGNAVPVASLKGALGHTLGAAGALEIALCLIAQRAGLMPGTVGLESQDPAIACHVLTAPVAGEMPHLLSNAFGFGGSNAAVVLSRE